MHEASAPRPRVAAVSVVVPCYRCSATIERAAKSVAAQTRPAAELLLIDDASGDDTLASLQRLARRPDLPRVRVIGLERNGGPATARNAGWAAASQPHVAFLDADDAWHPRKLELQMDYLERHSEVAVCGHLASLDGLSTVVPAGVAPSAIKLGALRILLSNPFTPSSVVVRRDLPLRFAEGRRYMEDHLLWLRASFSGIRVIRLEEALAQTFKAPYGESGQSAQLWQMELGELANYADLRNEGFISAPARGLLTVYSLLKFGRRLAVVSARRLSARSTKSR